MNRDATITRRTALMRLAAGAALIYLPAPVFQVARRPGLKTANVLDFGADPRGERDSWPAFYRAQLALDRRGGEIIVPPAAYRLTRPLSFERWTRGEIRHSLFIFDGAKWGVVSGPWDGEVLVEYCELRARRPGSMGALRFALTDCEFREARFERLAAAS